MLLAQETMNGTGNPVWFRRPGMVQETLDGSGDHEWYRR